MQFHDIIGQENIKNQLRRYVAEDKVPHALLFHGKSGVGKLQTALAFAQYLACTNRTSEDSCGKCPACMQYSKLQHPDLHFVFPIFKRDSSHPCYCDEFVGSYRDLILRKRYFSQSDWQEAIGGTQKQLVIYEAESSEILRKLSLKAFSDGYKAMIIWLPEKMHDACANKLLKLLEEPPAKTLFILVSEDPEQVITTIRSRCRQIFFPPLPDDIIAKALRDGNEDIDISTALSFAHIGNGSYLKAYNALHNDRERADFFDDFVGLMRKVWQVGIQKDYAALRELTSWSEMMGDSKVGRDKQKAFLRYMQEQVRENFIYNIQHHEINYQTQAEHQFSTKFSPFINERNVEGIMAELEKAENQILQNGNGKLIFYDLVLQLLVLIKK